jgi:hypothetical protein
LRDLAAKLDGNDELNGILSEVASNKAEVKKLLTEAGSSKVGSEEKKDSNKPKENKKVNTNTEN